ncbi:MAG TPA: transporter substrate-binding domain-containing protein [Spirochaetia bacterium]|nr:transporter substrate-binding domain-containing protein [Spirochaetales bacterium]HRS65979.1 transporter substrate-binding domain-containing protein [Spirochaetia bacterium]HRV28586.1 transporter substrate-binding domain-containing protein [Spirochaetia bacterium]
MNNDLDALKTKVDLLNPNLKDAPYLADYLSQGEQYDSAVFDYLLSKGADPDKIDQSGYGPLYYAIRNENLDAVQRLIAAKADVNASWKYNTMIIHIDNEFLFYDFFDPVKQVWTDRIDNIDIYDFYQMRPLVIALRQSNIEITKALLKAGADPLGITYKVKNAKASTSKNTVYYVNTVFDIIIGTFATIDLSQISYYYFANALQVWKAVNNLPKNKQPVVDKKLTSNVLAYLAMANMQGLKAELSKGRINTLELLKYAVFTENWDIVDFLLKLNNKELVKLLLDYKADPNNGIPLFYAKNNEIRDMLINAGADAKVVFNYPVSSNYPTLKKASLLFAAAAADGSVEAIQYWLEKNQTPIVITPNALRMYVNNFPPLYYKDENGSWTGLEVEVVTAIVKKAGLEIVYKQVPWSRALYEMQRGNLDIMSNLSITPERSEYLYWIGPIRISIMALAVQKKDAGLPITKLEDFISIAKARNSAFGIQQDVIYSHEFNEKLKNEEFHKVFEYVNDANLNPAKTVSGRIIGFIEELYYLRYLIASNPEYNNLVIHKFRLELENIYIGLSKQSVSNEIYQKLKQAYEDLKKDGTVDAILRKYIK